MAVNVTKTSHFTGSAGSQISFSQIRAQFGGSATNIKASTYLRNDDAAVDWDDESTITSRVPDATENNSVATDNNWSVDSLRNTISDYLVTQSGTDTELEFSDSNTATWNNNLSKNVPKTFDVTGIVHADSPTDDALRFDGNLYNLEIEVDENGAIYGESGNVGGDGGDALYVNNTYTQRDVEIRSYGKIWAGGGGGSSGNSGNSGSALNCSGTNNPVTRNRGMASESEKYNSVTACLPGEIELTRNPIGGQRGRCRGGNNRAGQGWNQHNKSGYFCANTAQSNCVSNFSFTVGGGSGGSGGTGGKGKGWSNRNTAITSAPHIGNSGNSGNTNSCGANGNNSTGNSGNAGNSGGDWGIASAGGAGRAIQKKGSQVNYYTDNTVKGKIKNI